MKCALFESVFALMKVYCKNYCNISVHFKIDNTSTTVSIHKYSAPNEQKEFWEFCIDRKIYVIASYIKSSNNKVASFEFMKTRENLEWSIQRNIFLTIKTCFKCNFTIDLFALE